MSGMSRHGRRPALAGRAPARPSLVVSTVVVSLVLLPGIAGALQSAAAPPAIDMPGKVAGLRDGGVQVEFAPDPARTPVAGDAVEFSLMVQGVEVRGGAGVVSDVGIGELWVRVTEGRPGLRMDALIHASGVIDFDELFRRVARRMVTGDCVGLADFLQVYADAGVAGAQRRLGTLYARACDVPQDVATALRWWARAADGGDAGAMFNLTMASEGDESFRWAQRAAATGDPIGLTALSAVYSLGRGVQPDAAEAVRLARQAAEAGDPRGCAVAAQFYVEGMGVERDIDAALRLLRCALEADPPDPSGLFVSGRMYENGWGVPRDLDEAVRLYEQAAAGGLPVALEALKRLRR